MPSKSASTSQGQAWDQLAKERYGRETMLGVLLPENVEQMDSLLFSGETVVLLPDVQTERARSLPPWERL
jgi:hypothetical protein